MTGTEVAEDDTGYQPLGGAEVVGRSEGAVRLRAGAVTVEVAALDAGVFRIGMFGAGRPPAYVTEAVPELPPVPRPVEIVEGGGTVTLHAAAAAARVELSPLRLSFTDADGEVFAADDPGLGMGFVPRQRGLSEAGLGDAPRLYKRREEDERFFGGGERTSGLEKTGSFQLFWNIDPPAGHNASLNNLYTSIPFVLVLRHGRAHGLFLDSAHRSWMDLAKADPHLVGLGADGGDLVYYVISGPTPREVIERYTGLTGRTPMPPLWSLGNHQSRWGYETADEVRRVVREFRQFGIPLDAIYLDIDYMDGFRVFTWDEDRFPKPGALIAELRDQGVRTVTIVDPGVKVDEDYAVYREGRERGLFCLTADGDEFHNVVWPGLCAFPDFTNRRTRAWWGQLHRALLDVGVAGIWCDMNEPTMFVPPLSTMPSDVVHPGGGATRLHAEVHNLYGSLMARAAREGVLSLRPEQRPFVITRSGFAGLQRHAMHWTGDNTSWWEHLWMSLPQLQNLGLSGVAWNGVDIGGFGEDCNGELLARFTEFGAFQPFCRNHSAKDTVRQEPWAFGEPYTSVCRDMLQLRMRLLPYLYGLFEECHRTGAPILRPLLFEYPDDPVTYTADDEMLVGRDLLLAPITRQGVEHRHVYLPAGSWVHWWTGERLDGPTHVLAHAPLGQPALYARANTPLPMWPAMTHTGDAPPDPLTLRVYCAPGASAGESSLYEDEGDGFRYRQGVFARRRVGLELGDRLTVWLGERQGGWAPPRRSVEIELWGTGPVDSVLVDGAAYREWRRDGDALIITVAERAEPTMVEIATA